jgi:beta-aspartyl-peptidase (threonine type)
MSLLAAGAHALDAVQRAVEVLEDDPRFNAGTGACLSEDGHVEHDAALMDGAGLRAGAVCALRGFKNPISIARAVLEDGQHVLYAAEGAARFATRAGFSSVEEASLVTDAARERLIRVLQKGAPQVWAGGTVGAVARDVRGGVAAATSTGGVVAKRAGRVGDTPVLGAGTYADDLAGAGSATGAGEPILRVTLTASVVAALRAGALPARAACDAVEMLEQRTSGRAGLIVVDTIGRLAFARNTETMSWAAAWEGGEPCCGT